MSQQINDIISFLKDLKKSKGGYIFTAIILSKLLGFLLTVFVTRSISTTAFGNVSYAYTIIAFIAPFAGFGIFQSLGRFGPLQKSQLKKKRLFNFVLKRGVIASLFLTATVIIFSGLLTTSLPESQNQLIIISFLIVSLFIFEVIKIYYRIHHINKLFAYLEISNSIVLVVTGVILTYFFDGNGYLISLVISPLIISIYIVARYGILQKNEANEYPRAYKKSLWSYGFFTSLGGLSSQLIFSIDMLTIGYLIQDPKEIAYYKAASLVPFALLFIPAGVMKTDLVKLTQHYQNKAFLKKYANNYLKLFFVIAIITATTLYFSANIIMKTFGDEYVVSQNLIPVFALGLVGAFIFRTPFGNIITCVGWTKANTLISVIILLLDIVLNLFLVNKYGIIGAAYSTTILLWTAGIASYLVFLKYLQTLD